MSLLLAFQGAPAGPTLRMRTLMGVGLEMLLAFSVFMSGLGK